MSTAPSGPLLEVDSKAQSNVVDLSNLVTVLVSYMRQHRTIKCTIIICLVALYILQATALQLLVHLPTAAVYCDILADRTQLSSAE